jgi:hypothetical protein
MHVVVVRIPCMGLRAASRVKVKETRQIRKSDKAMGRKFCDRLRIRLRIVWALEWREWPGSRSAGCTSYSVDREPQQLWRELPAAAPQARLETRASRSSIHGSPPAIDPTTSSSIPFSTQETACETVFTHSHTCTYFSWPSAEILHSCPLGQCRTRTRRVGILASSRLRPLPP